MESPYSVLALDAAGWLDSELASAATHLGALGAQLDRDASGPLVRAIAAARSTARQLREHLASAAVVEGETAIEVCEQALRARLAVVFRALHTLADVEAEIPATAFLGRFRSVRDLAEHLKTHLAAIDERWLRERAGSDRTDPATPSELAYAALDEAEVALESIGQDPLLRQFLRAGRASSMPAVRAACLEIAVSVGLGCDIAPRRQWTDNRVVGHEAAP